jgi:hypothetical protein
MVELKDIRPVRASEVFIRKSPALVGGPWARVAWLIRSGSTANPSHQRAKFEDARRLWPIPS